MKFDKFAGFLSASVIFLLLVNTNVVQSDEECSVCEDVETPTATGSKEMLSNNTESDEGKKKEVPKKSLTLVFDGTGSMSTDLAQLRGAAQEIVKTLSELKDNPIGNYVLSVFRDPGWF